MKRRSMGALIGIIDSLDKGSKEALANERKQLLEMQVSNGFDDSVLHGIYGNVTSYLHKTYLAEINWFKPMNPKPRPIRNEEE